MKTFWKRLLAVSLSAALLIGCAVSGLVLPAAAQTTAPESSAPTNLIPGGDFDAAFSAAATINSSKVAVNQTAGVDGTPAWEIAPGTGTGNGGSFSIKLDTPLVAGKHYIFRMKTKGGADKKFHIYSEKFTTSQTLRSETEWSEVQAVFAATKEETSLSGMFFINESANPSYVDDIRLYEYVPGMNLYADEWESPSVPYMYSVANQSSNIFQSFANFSHEKETPESSNYVERFTASTDKYLKFGMMYGVIGSGAVIKVNQPFLFSFRFKGEAGTDAAFRVTTNTSKGPVKVLRQSTTEADENGWKTYTGLYEFSHFDSNWQYIAHFTGATTITVDDIFVGEAVEVDITTADCDMLKGEYKQLEYSVLPLDYPVTFTSSNPAVATVDKNGKVIAMDYGTAKITATILGGVTDVFNVNVVRSKNLITNGDLEGDEWQGASAYIQTVDNNTVLAINHAKDKYIGLPKSLQLSKAFEAGKYYIFRMKVKGGAGSMYTDRYGTVRVATPPNGGVDWYSLQYVFTPHANDVGKTTFGGWYYYNDRTDKATEDSYVYYDNFEIYEFTPGMNIMDSSVANGEALPTDIWAGYADYMTLDTINGNSVIKINAGHKTSYTGFSLMNYKSVLKKNVTYNVSFRYKTTTKPSQFFYGTNRGTEKIVDDPNNEGWKIYSTTFNFSDSMAFDSGYAAYMGGQDTWIDDIVIAEATTFDVSPAGASLKLDETLQATYTASHEGYEVKWLSLDESVATVDQNGKITAVGYGKTTISALWALGGVDSFEVEVVKFKNLITNGSFEGSEWSSYTNIEADKGFGGGKAFGVPNTGTASQTKSFAGSKLVLSESLKPGKVYVLRFKTKGGNAEWYTNSTALPSGLSIYNKEATGVMNIEKPETQTDWIQWSTTFTVSEEKTAIDGTINLYNYNHKVTTEGYDKAGTIYYDDLEVFEYVPGFNLAESGESCEVLPSFSNRTTMVNLHGKFEMYNDNGNYVWKSKHTSTWDMQYIYLNQQLNMSWVGKKINVSFRYKRVNTNGGMAVSYGSAFTSYDNEWISSVKAVGDWYYYTATTKKPIENGNNNFQLQIGFQNIDQDGYVLVDDFYFGEAVGIDIAEEEVKLNVGDEKDLTTTVEPATNVVSWTSSNTAVATVDATGKVTAVGKGTATIAARLPDDTVDTCVVNVYNDFAMSMQGFGIHFVDGAPEGSAEYADGIRFGTKLDFGEGYQLNEGGKLQLAYNGVYYDVVSMGMLLKRAANETALEVANVGGTGASTVWSSVAYSQETNKLKCVEQGDDYIVFVVNMMTSTPSTTFNEREYDARGYIQLDVDGVIETIYTDVMTDSVKAAFDREAAQA